MIMQIVAHAEILQAEIQRIDLDIQHLDDASKRYATNKSAFLQPQKDLKKLRATKEATLKEIRAHLQCYQLHQSAGQQLLSRLNKPEAASRPSSSSNGTNGGQLAGASANSSFTNPSRQNSARKVAAAASDRSLPLPQPRSNKTGNLNHSNGLGSAILTS